MELHDASKEDHHIVRTRDGFIHDCFVVEVGTRPRAPEKAAYLISFHIIRL